MLKWIERTRKKPRAVRDQYAFMGAIAITGIIALGWLVTLPIRFDGVTLEMDSIEESRGAFSQFLTNTRDQAAAILEAGESEELQGSTSTPTSTGTERWPLGTSSATRRTSTSSWTAATTSATNGTNTQVREPVHQWPRTVRIGTTSSRTTAGAEDVE